MMRYEEWDSIINSIYLADSADDVIDNTSLVFVCDSWPWNSKSITEKENYYMHPQSKLT